MSVRVTCPTCRLPLLVSDVHKGKVVRCPGCQQTFQTRSPAADSPLRLPDARPGCVGARPTRLELGWATSQGRARSRNEDSLQALQLAWAGSAGRHELALLLLADGMGGHAAGDRASNLAVGAMLKALAPRLAGLAAGEEPLPDAGGLVELLDQALWEANRTIACVAGQEPDCAGMGATAVCGLAFDGACAICHVGDCRAYHHRSGKLRRITRDQTLAQRLVDLGTLSEDEARNHPSASQVAQALGRHYDLEPSRQTLELAGGDWLVLSCDGLHAHLDEAAIAAVIDTARQATELAQALVDRANAAGGSDNCTVIAVRGC